MSDIFTIHTDGGSRGNPGPAAFAYTIERPGASIIEEKGYLGDTTNNIAEYAGIVKALHHAADLGAKAVVLNSDSELLVQQMNGRYKVKNPGILPLFQEACRLAKAIGNVKIRHIYREHNSRADRLCNDALDDRHSLPVIEILPKKTPTDAKTAEVKPAEPKVARREVGKPDALREAAVAVLRNAAQAWADGEDDAPTPDEVWDRLRELIRNPPV
jgi:ribonuclease HI